MSTCPLRARRLVASQTAAVTRPTLNSSVTSPGQTGRRAPRKGAVPIFMDWEMIRVRVISQHDRHHALILEDVSRGEPEASEKLLPLVDNELRNLATARMLRESSGHTLQPTALVLKPGCAWLAMAANRGKIRRIFLPPRRRSRRILVEHARRKSRFKHGGGLQRMSHRRVGTGRSGAGRKNPARGRRWINWADPPGTRPHRGPGNISAA